MQQALLAMGELTYIMITSTTKTKGREMSDLSVTDRAIELKHEIHDHQESVAHYWDQSSQVTGYDAKNAHINNAKRYEDLLVKAKDGLDIIMRQLHDEFERLDRESELRMECSYMNKKYARRGQGVEDSIEHLESMYWDA